MFDNCIIEQILPMLPTNTLYFGTTTLRFGDQWNSYQTHINFCRQKHKETLTTRNIYRKT